MGNPFKRLVVRGAKLVGILVLVLAMAGLVYQQVGLRRDAGLAPPASEMVVVNGRHVHVVCMGEGAQTFVLDAGLGAWSIRTPFIYVGHSLGAIFAQIYYAMNPGDIAGLVLLDPGSPQALLAGFPGGREAAVAASDCPPLCQAARISTLLGLSRLAVSAGGTVSFPDPWVRTQYRAAFAQPHTAMTLAAELAAAPKTAYQNQDIASFHDTPILILRSAERVRPDKDETAAEFAKSRDDYRAYLVALAAKSTRSGRPLQVPQSTHATMLIGEMSAKVIADHILEFAGGLDIRFAVLPSPHPPAPVR